MEQQQQPKNETGHFLLTTESEFDAIKYDTEKEILISGSVHAPQFQVDQEKERKPIDLVAVVDISGSMDGTIGLVKDALLFMLSQLKTDDYFSLVTYHTEVHVDMPLTQMTKQNKETTEKIITGLKTRDMTNLSGGLFEGINQISQRKIKHEVASVLLFTDGQANVGITQKEKLVEETTSLLSKLGDACSVFTFGFGANHSESLLRVLADSANGMYYFMEKADDIPDAFADTLGGLLSVVGQNVNMKVEVANPNVQITKIWTKYKNTSPSTGVHEIKISDIYGEEIRDLVFTIKVPAVDQPQDSYPLVKFSLECFNVLTSTIETKEATCSIRRTKEETNQLASYSLDKQRNRLISGDALVKARQLGDDRKFDEGKKVLDEAIARLESSVSAQDPLVKEFIQDMKEAKDGLIDRVTYSARGGKFMAMKEQKFSKQRAAGSGYGETSYKKKMKEDYYQSKAAPTSSATPTPTPTPQSSATVPVTLSQPQQNSKILLIGNTHKDIPESEQEESKATPGQKLAHEWTLYCRGNDLDFVEKVVFTIHSTYNPNVITVASAPFEITRKGWGFFKTIVTIHFKNTVRQPLDVEHMLSFDGDGKFQEVLINL